MANPNEMKEYLQDCESGISNMIERLKEHRNSNPNPNLNKTILDNAIESLKIAHKSVELLLKDLEANQQNE